MGFQCGIVGLPNIGKSTLFNALTATQAAEAANYPFCTIEPNVGRVGVFDERLHTLARLAQSQKIIPTQLEFVDIAGLVRGASRGEGLGNQFLGHIRSTDAIIHVLRCFEDENVTHVDQSIDPLRDSETIETELMLADLESLEKRLPLLQKKAKTGEVEAKSLIPVIEVVLTHLGEGNFANTLRLNKEDDLLVKRLQLLTSKPIMYVCNVGENDALTGNLYTQKVRDLAKKKGYPCVIISASIEAEIAQLASEEDKKSFLDDLGLHQTGLNQVVQVGYGLLDLLTFFTIGPKEARAWTIFKGAKAPQAAGVIHTDFERGFICAETISYTDYVECGNEQQAKNLGKMRLEGRDYLVQDNDIFHFRFNV